MSGETLSERLRAQLSVRAQNGGLWSYLSALWNDEGAKVALAVALGACLSVTQGIGLLLLLPLLQLVGFITGQSTIFPQAVGWCVAAKPSQRYPHGPT